MAYRTRIYYTDADKELMWDRWQAGESLHSIARLFDRNRPSIQGILARSGGIRPAKRRRSRLALSMAEREEISRGVVIGGWSVWCKQAGPEPSWDVTTAAWLLTGRLASECLGNPTALT